MSRLFLSPLYLSLPLVSCFEGDETPPGDTEKKFSQAELNAFLAEEKRKHQASAKAALETAEKNLEDSLATQKLTEQERTELQDKLTTIQSQLRTKDEQARINEKRIKEEAEAATKAEQERSKFWENRFKTNEVARSLQDAAVAAEAFRPDQIVSLLRPGTKLVEKTDDKGKGIGEFDIVVDLHDLDADGNATVTTRSPKEAVARMKELPDIYGNLFKSGVVAGVGSGAGVGVTGNGQVDVKKMTTEQYMKARKENPAALGLPTRR